MAPDTAAPLRLVLVDGELTYRLRCPECGHEGDIDQDQAAGRVSCDHSGGREVGGCGCGCAYHATRNWLAEFRDRLDLTPALDALDAGKATTSGLAAFLGMSEMELSLAERRSNRDGFLSRMHAQIDRDRALLDRVAKGPEDV